MEFKIKQSVLKDALAAVQGALEKKGTIPVLSNVLIESVGEGNIQVTATDLDVTIRKTVAANVIAAGSLCVIARKLYELTRNLPEGELHIGTEKNHWATLRSGKSTFKIAGVPKDQFPVIAINKATPLKLSTAKLREYISRTSFATSRDVSRYTRQGILMKVQDGEIVVAACDGARVAVVSDSLTGSGEVDVLIPIRALPLIAALEGDTAFFGVENQHIFVQTEDTIIVFRRLTGQFPNYKLIMPNGEERFPCKVDLEAFRSVIKRTALMADDRNESFRMEISKGQIAFTARCSEITDASEVIDAEYDGPDKAYGFQWTHLLDYLNVLGKTEKLTIWVDPREPSNNSTDKPVEMLGEGIEGYRFVVAPLNLAVARV